MPMSSDTVARTGDREPAGPRTPADPGTTDPGTADPGTSEPGRPGLFPGDTGTLEEATRRVLLQLLRGPYIHRERHPRLWPVVIRDEEILRSRLADLFLTLVVDTDRGVAFIRNAEPAQSDDIPKVTRSTPLSLLDTGLVLLLRDALLRAETQDSRAFIDRSEIDDALSVYRPATSTDQAMFERRVNTAVERFKTNSVLLSTAEPDRFEISPVLALIFDADEVATVRGAIDRLLDDGSPAAVPTPDDSSDEEDDR